MRGRLCNFLGRLRLGTPIGHQATGPESYLFLRQFRRVAARPRNAVRLRGAFGMSGRAWRQVN